MYVHMGQFPKDGNFEHYSEIFLKKVNDHWCTKIFILKVKVQVLVIPMCRNVADTADVPIWISVIPSRHHVRLDKQTKC